MKSKKLLLIIGIPSTLLLITYLSICTYFYNIQENLVFAIQKVSNNHQFTFDYEFTEINIAVEDATINSLLLQASSKKSDKLIFYLHGNAQTITDAGSEVAIFLQSGYDVFLPEYRGYGKSTGTITSEDQLHNDIQATYNHIKQTYKEENIIIVGYSLGTGFASKLATKSTAKHLILKAPHYSIPDVINHMCNTHPSLINNIIQFLPIDLILKYKFETNFDLKSCKMPVTIFHGNKDESMYYGSSLKLKKHFKPSDRLITLESQGNLNFDDNKQYKKEILTILKE